MYERASNKFRETDPLALCYYCVSNKCQAQLTFFPRPPLLSTPPRRRGNLNHIQIVIAVTSWPSHGGSDDPSHTLTK